MEYRAIFINHIVDHPWGVEEKMDIDDDRLMGACVLIINPQGKYLLGKRLNSYKAGTYGIPGGRIKLGEAVEETIRREIKEETNLVARKLSLIMIVREYQSSNDFTHYVFYCDQYQGELSLNEPDKCEGWSWYTTENLPSPLLPSVAIIFKEYTPNQYLRFIDAV